MVFAVAKLVARFALQATVGDWIAEIGVADSVGAELQDLRQNGIASVEAKANAVAAGVLPLGNSVLNALASQAERVGSQVILATRATH